MCHFVDILSAYIMNIRQTAIHISTAVWGLFKGKMQSVLTLKWLWQGSNLQQLLYKHGTLTYRANQPLINSHLNELIKSKVVLIIKESRRGEIRELTYKKIFHIILNLTLKCFFVTIINWINFKLTDVVRNIHKLSLN